MSANNIPHILENAHVVVRTLPLVPELQLYLLSDTYPVESLAREEYDRLMQRPPYWAFCWGGGQALARWIFDQPQVVEGRLTIDFGAGSGVAGIAAGKCGAAEVIAVDIDPDALQVCELNGRLNAVDLTTSLTFPRRSEALLLAADVGYEEEGFAAVVRHIEQGGAAIIAESRLRNLQDRFPALRLKSRLQVRTFPELDEAEMFDEVHIYATF